jgi:streptogramin lyase
MRLWRLCVVSAVVATWAGCGGEDDPVPPPPPDNQGGEANDAGSDAAANNGGGGNGGTDAGGTNGGTGGTGGDAPDAMAGTGGTGGTPDEPDADADIPAGDGDEGDGDTGDGDVGDGDTGDGDPIVDGGDGGDVADASDADAADVADAGPTPFDPGPSGTLIEFPMPVIEGGAPASSGEMRIAAGDDDKLYVTDSELNIVYRMDVEGNFEEFQLAPSSRPRGITLGPDGNVWFVLYGSSRIASITPSGTITEYPTPTPGSGPMGITTGQDNNLWFTEQVANRVARATLTEVDGGTNVTITELPLLQPASYIKDITRGPGVDNHMWFTEQAGRIGKVTLGLYVESGMEYGSSEFTAIDPPLAITTGPDGNLWFTRFGSQVGMIDTSGTITLYPTDTGGCVPVTITVGSDGKLWYACYNLSMLGATDPADPNNPESHTLYAIDSQPTGVVSGPGGAIWFVEEGARNVGYYVP